MIDNEIEVVERYELSDDEEDGEFDYAAIPAGDAAFDGDGDDGDDDDDDDGGDDFAAALASINKAADRGGHAHGETGACDVLTQVRPSVVDDFVRNFLIKVGLVRTLESFNAEWYELQAKGKLSEEHVGTVPDIYVRNQDLDEAVGELQGQLEKMRAIAQKAQGTWDTFRRERDFHRMHHRRVVQEKEKLVNDLTRLRKHYLSYEPTLNDLQRKYETAMKEKMLTRLERDRVKARQPETDAPSAALGGWADSTVPRLRPPRPSSTAGPRTFSPARWRRWRRS